MPDRLATYTGATIARLDPAGTYVAWQMTARAGSGHPPHCPEIVAWCAESGLLHSPKAS